MDHGISFALNFFAVFFAHRGYQVKLIIDSCSGRSGAPREELYFTLAS